MLPYAAFAAEGYRRDNSIMAKFLNIIAGLFEFVHAIVLGLRYVLRLLGHWLQLRLYAWAAIVLVAVNSLVTRNRMSHVNGIATRGKVRFLDRLDGVPANDFFRPGLEFPARCRFASVSFMDDAMFIARAASIKFADDDARSPLDLLMNTGQTAPFWNVRTFWQFLIANMKGLGAAVVPYMKSDPTLYVGSIDPLRRNPETFAQMYYYSQIPFTFKAKDSRPRYVNFRLIPWDRGVEAGLLEPEDTPDWAWCWEGIRPGETRSPNYLKDELAARLARGPIRFHLQIQFHDIRPGENRKVLSASMTWDEVTHPWHDLAEVTIEDMLDYKTSNETVFMIGNRPACMGIVAPRSIDDPAGMNYMRDLADFPARCRLLGNRLFGLPKPIPDARGLGPDTRYTPFKDPENFGVPKPLSLPQKESAAEQASRRQDLGLRREEYVLTVPGDLPTYTENLPATEAMDDEANRRMFDDIEATMVQLGLGAVQRFFVDGGVPARTLETFDALYPIRQTPAVNKSWRDDAEYARQRLNGVHPTVITLCTAVPDKFPVTDQMVGTLLPHGSSLAQELANEKLFLLDYPLLDDLPTNDGQYLAAPVCLLHLERDGTLLPIAIQLAQDPAESPIFTPLDPPWLWMAVKAFAQSADAHYHELVAHLLRTHLLLEPIWLCARRHLHDRHPLLELLKPHFKFTLAINHAARTSMLVPGGPLPTVMAAGYDGNIELLRRAFKDFGFHRFDIEDDLDSRGVNRKDAAGRFKLPNYFYRDDGILVSRAVRDWVREMVGIFYQSDEDVLADVEVAAWVAELADPARGNLPGLPNGGRLQTIDDLVDFLALTVVKASAEHSAANNGQYDYFGYVPNVPGLMRKPPPRNKKELTEQWLVEALPDFHQSAVQIAMVHLLSDPAPPDRILGFYSDDFFAGHAAAIHATRRFRASLDRISAGINTRNVMLDVPYPYLDPRRISQSTEI